jgi:hypothetical protein
LVCLCCWQLMSLASIEMASVLPPTATSYSANRNCKECLVNAVT